MNTEAMRIDLGDGNIYVNVAGSPEDVLQFFTLMGNKFTSGKVGIKQDLDDLKEHKKSSKRGRKPKEDSSSEEVDTHEEIEVVEPEIVEENPFSDLPDNGAEALSELPNEEEKNIESQQSVVPSEDMKDDDPVVRGEITVGMLKMSAKEYAVRNAAKYSLPIKQVLESICRLIGGSPTGKVRDVLPEKIEDVHKFFIHDEILPDEVPF